MKIWSRVTGSLRMKLMLSFSILVATIALFVFVFFPARFEKQALEATISNANDVRDMTAFSVSAGLVFGDTAAVNEVLTGATRGRNVRLLLVRDSSGKVFAGHGEATTLVMPPSDTIAVVGGRRLYTTSTPVYHGDKTIGSLLLGMSLAELEQEVWRARALGATIGALILLIGLAIVYALSTMVTRPLNSVSRTMNLIAQGDMSLRATVSADREVEQLIGAFNKMVDNVASVQGQLSAANQRLEATVEARTAKLRESIAEQRRVQTALRESEAAARGHNEMLQCLIDVAPQAIVVVDVHWNISRWNLAAERLFGWRAEEVMGKQVPYVPEHDAENFREWRKRIEQDNVLLPIEVVRVRKDGTEVSVLVSASVLRDNTGNPSGYIAVVTDLTDRKLLEDQLRQSQKMEAVGRLAGGVAHDFNNLLTVITSYSAMLLEQSSTDGEKEDLEQITAAAIRASALTRQLLTFSRKQIVHLEAIQLNEVVTNMDPMLKRLMRANIQWTTLFDAELPTVSADPTQIEQVIMNLAVNASDAMPDGGRLTVETRSVFLDAAYVAEHAGSRFGQHVMLAMTDTGCGMDSETVKRIFEPFFTTKEVGQGTGLGLATTYAVVNQLGGHIVVSSTPGIGTTFRILLPAIESSPVNDVVQKSEEHSAAHKGSGLVVLLVEDEEGVRRVIRRGLEARGFEVLEAADAEAALAVSANRPGVIHVLLSDLMMPGLNGRQLAEVLASSRPDMKVLFMSGYADDTVERNGLISEGRGFLQKPFSIGALVNSMHFLMQESAISRVA